MKSNKKLLVSALALGSIMIAAPAGSVFATTINNGEANVPAYLTAAATNIDVTIGGGFYIGDTPIIDLDGQQGSDVPIVDPTPDAPNSGDEYLDFDSDGEKDPTEPLVSEFEADAVYMRVGADSNIGMVTNLRVTNNNTSSPVFISKISVNPVGPYTKQVFNPDEFKTYAANSHNFALQLNGSIDLYNDYTPNTSDIVGGGETQIYSLNGLSSVVTEGVTNEKIADVIVTVSQTQN